MIWPLLVALTVGVAWGPVVTGAAASAETQPAPKAVPRNVSHDFGLVQPDSQVTHQFIIENQGEADLIIESVAPG
jgi:hypothetical protein